MTKTLEAGRPDVFARTKRFQKISEFWKIWKFTPSQLNFSILTHILRFFSNLSVDATLGINCFCSRTSLKKSPVFKRYRKYILMHFFTFTQNALSTATERAKKVSKHHSSFEKDESNWVRQLTERQQSIFCYRYQKT